jgi:hypothetical protein
LSIFGNLGFLVTGEFDAEAPERKHYWQTMCSRGQNTYRQYHLFNNDWPKQIPEGTTQEHQMSHTQQPHGRQDAYGYQPAPGVRAPTKKRRVFLWVFLAIQALFVIWLVTGLATVQTGATHAQLASACYHHAWSPLFKSQTDCVTHYGGALTGAGDAGKAIGAGLIVVFWVVVDIILGISYGVYKLARR